MNNFLTSLTQSQKLKAIGVPQSKSQYVWYVNGTEAHLLTQEEGFRPMESKSYDAYLSDELLMMLPAKIGVYGLEIKKHPDHWSVCYAAFPTVPPWLNGSIAHKERLIDALTKVLLSLIEQKIINVEDLKLV